MEREKQTDINGNELFIDLKGRDKKFVGEIQKVMKRMNDEGRVVNLSAEVSERIDRSLGESLSGIQKDLRRRTRGIIIEI